MPLLNVQIAASQATQTGGTLGGGSTAGLGAAGYFTGALQLGLAAYQLSNSLSAASDMKRSALAQANIAREIARKNNRDEIFKVELTLSRTLKRMTAAFGSGGFSTGSQSTLAIKNQQKNDAQLLEIQSNTKLDRTLQEIQRQESAARKKARGIANSGIIKMGITAVGVVAAPFTGGASLVAAGAATSAV